LTKPAGYLLADQFKGTTRQPKPAHRFALGLCRLELGTALYAVDWHALAEHFLKAGAMTATSSATRDHAWSREKNYARQKIRQWLLADLCSGTVLRPLPAPGAGSARIEDQLIADDLRQFVAQVGRRD